MLVPRTPIPLLPSLVHAMVIAGVVLGLANAARGQKKEESNEFVLKARMIQKMIPFVAWPKGTFVQGKTEFTIGILGEDPFGGSLDKAFQEARPKGCKVRIVRLGAWSKLENPKGLLACHAVFVSSTEEKQLPRILAQLRAAPIWILSDTTGFAKQGVHLNFFVAQSRTRFETNSKAARAAKLEMSSKLLRLGRDVEERRK